MSSPRSACPLSGFARDTGSVSPTNFDPPVARPPPTAVARAALTFAVVAMVALPIDLALWWWDAFSRISQTSECCPSNAKPVWLAISQTAVSLTACTGIGLAIAILAQRDLRRRSSNRRRAIAAIVVGAITTAVAVLFN